ncbi:DUF1684 domain-containing protein [Lewinella sp. JB7]|uniref:DUF1684 domain-containing protein n=1 Tax=Lewinella sp. JB7 TaxID=2962887 RepID=UPI0020C9ED09|nr:DUF1684 domain-containing protein [Lewinella sp. JB7]MCP9236554.1 DUF1684 domain-containing protein [Lewinella sp. JB7]
MNKLLPLLGFVFLLAFRPIPLHAQMPDTDAPPDRTGELIDRLYSVEGFQARFSQALEANPAFTANAGERVFIDRLSARARESALFTYATAVRTMLEDFTPEEIEAMITALDSPAGPPLIRLLLADQLTLHQRLADYVTTIVDDGLAALVTRDSLLYMREFSQDLRQIMDGEYLDSPLPGAANTVRREGNLQTEQVGEAIFRFDIEWLSNSKYSISDRKSNPVTLGPPLVVNIYEIEGNEFRYIWMNPDGSYGKDHLIKTGYTSYEQELKTFRWALNEQYLSPGTSPLPAADREAFAAGEGHGFYPPDESLRITARFTPDTTFAQLTMATSSADSVTYRVYGKAHFKVGGEAQELTLYQSTNDEVTTLFVPFQDATSGTSSYGGGRYMDVPVPAGDTVVLDFNKAYNPYCAYTDGYACPVPPAENRLRVAVAAGVMAPVK